MGLKDAERATGISADQLRDACKRGDLPSRKNGTRYVIRTADLEAWIDSLPDGRQAPDA
ncbi:MAG: helix-turn-helix domain-containing protein [Tessaracoccus sp.]|nr:helix-turn-helix domain-containing protein [Tessaracoccus sp.]